MTVCIVWGTTYLAIAVALETIPPMVMAALRWIIGGGILTIGLKAAGTPLPDRREWPALAVLGILMLGFGNGGVVWAELTVPSGLTALLVATVPFWMVGIEALRRGAEPLGARRVVGLLVGFIGIVMLVWPELRVGPANRGFIVGVVASQIACVGWAIGSSYARRRRAVGTREVNTLATVAIEMLFGGAALLLVGLALGEWSRVAFNVRTSIALAHLIVFGGIAGFTAYAYALKHLPVATVSLYAYVNPIIAVALGTIVLREPFSPRMGAAALVVLIGMGLVRSD